MLISKSRSPSCPRQPTPAPASATTRAGHCTTSNSCSPSLAARRCASVG